LALSTSCADGCLEPVQGAGGELLQEPLFGACRRGFELPGRSDAPGRAGAQAHKFLTGFAPVRAAVRLGAAAGALLAIPAEQLRRDGAPLRAGAAPLSRQIQRGLTGECPDPSHDPRPGCCANTKTCLLS